MSSDQNCRESSVNVISCFTIWINGELCEKQFSLFFVILSEKLANFCVISSEIAKIIGIERETIHELHTVLEI